MERGGIKKIVLSVNFDLNRVLEMAKRSPHQYAVEKKKTESAIVWMLKGQGISRIDGRNWYSFTWFVPNWRKDPDNIAAGQKVIFDAMQKAGIIENDGHKQIAGFSHSFQIDKKKPRVEIEIERGERE